MSQNRAAEYNSQEYKNPGISRNSQYLPSKSNNRSSVMRNSKSRKHSQSRNSQVLNSPRLAENEPHFSPNQNYTQEYENEELRIPEKAMSPKTYQNTHFDLRNDQGRSDSFNRIPDAYAKHLGLPEFLSQNETNSPEMLGNAGRIPSGQNAYPNGYGTREQIDPNYIQSSGVKTKTSGILQRLRNQASQKYSIFANSNKEKDCEEEIELLKFERFQATMQLLVGHTLERPLFNVPPSVTEIFGFPPDTFTLSTITKFLQVSCQIVVIALTAESIQKRDSAVPIQVFSYLMAQAAINLIVSLVFLLRIIRVSYRGSIFYASISAILTFVAFGLVLGYLMRSECTADDLQVCHFRRATTGMVSLSTFIWLSEMVIFFTIILVASLEDVLPIPLLKKTENKPFVVDEKSFIDYETNRYDSDEETIQDKNQEFIVRKYIITEKGMEPVSSEDELQNKVRVELYVDDPKNFGSENKSNTSKKQNLN